MKILIIAPHPDDEALGCGGTIKKHVNEGNEVYLCIVTSAYEPEWDKDFLAKRKEEIACANKLLGIKKIFFLDFPTAKLDTVSQKQINDSILNCINEVKPEILYIPYNGDVHKDHRLVFEAAMVAARPKHDCPIKKIFCYEVISETDWAFHYFKDVFSPNVYVDISDTIKDKIKAISCYKSELAKASYSFTIRGINVLAQKRGIEAGLEAAEAFVLIRDIKK